MCDTTTTTTEKRVTIALSEEPPVAILPSEWPVIARASDHTGEHAFQANREWFVKVREHADGRQIVYGRNESGPGGMPLGWRGAHAGYLLAAGTADATVRAIRRVAGVLGEDAIADKVIADLPARKL